jgi:Tfp pilus assembly protein PilV
MARSNRAGCTLIEIIVALFVFTTGALALAAGSGVVARELGTNNLRAEAARVAASRLEVVHASCRIAQSGSETRGPILSRWSVSPLDSSSLRIEGTVSYITAHGSRSEPYAATVGCP